MVFVLETGIDVAYEIYYIKSVFIQGRKSIDRDGILTIVVIVAYNHLLDLSKLAHLTPKVLIEGIKVVLELRGRHLELWVVSRVLIEIRQENGLRVGWLDVFSRTSVAVSACADFVVEGAIHFVLFGTEDGGEIVGHDCCG